MIEFVELKINRSYINTNFEGYKLSLESLPMIKLDLNPKQYPSIQKLNCNQYSLLHSELFAKQNFLVQDPWNREASYFVGNNGLTIYCSNYEEISGRPNPLKIVFEFDPQMMLNSATYNISFKFVSEKYCLFCNGSNRIFLFDTSCRMEFNSWKDVFCGIIDKNDTGFILRDARLNIVDGVINIDCIFQHIKEENKINFNELYYGYCRGNVDNNWSWTLKDILIGQDLIYYCSFDTKPTSLVLCSNKTFSFKSNYDQTKVKNSETTGLIQENNCNYSWTQTEDEIVISFWKITLEKKDEIKIISTDENLTLKCGGQIMLNNEVLCQKVNSKLTTWSIENNVLRITLIKMHSCDWNFFVNSGPKETRKLLKTSSKQEGLLQNLETPYEECDLPRSDEEYFIDLIDLSSKTVTHKISLGNYPPLFSSIINPGFPPAIAIRNDVDALLWFHQYNPLKSNEWSLRHSGTLHAFGYIQASKEQKKYLDCSPDLGYSVIVEPYRYIFIYNSKYEEASDLRNRHGRHISIGKQNVVTLDYTTEILGISCGINYITLLSEKSLLYIQINQVKQ